MNASRSLEFQIRNRAGRLGGYGQLWEGRGGGGGGAKMQEKKFCRFQTGLFLSENCARECESVGACDGERRVLLSGDGNE
jgi:hypothetical protein